MFLYRASAGSAGAFARAGGAGGAGGRKSRLEWGNYATSDRAESLRAYRGDARTCQAGLRAVRAAVRSLAYLDITDADFFAACADGGRVECKRRDDGSIAAYYCAGQYYPTEYRHAIARAIDRAGVIAYQRAARAHNGRRDRWHHGAAPWYFLRVGSTACRIRTAHIGRAALPLHDSVASRATSRDSGSQ